MSKGKIAADALLKMRTIIQESMKTSTKTEKEVRKTLGVKRYAK